MLKFGIHSLGQLLAVDPSKKLRHRIAIDLYEKLKNSSLDDETISRFEESIICHFASATGVYRRTYRKRFASIEHELVSSVLGLVGGRPDLRVHDMGVSDGRTTVDWYNTIRSAYDGRLEYLASDLYFDLYIVNDTDNEHTFVAADMNWRPMQLVYPPFVFNLGAPESRIFYPINHLIRSILQKTHIEPLIRKAIAGDGTVRVRTCHLICNELSQLIDSGAVIVEPHDVLEKQPGEFDVIRAVNVLNPSYFSSQQIDTALSNIAEGLSDGGLFLVGSNENADTAFHGELLVKEDRMLKSVAVWNGGSPISDRVDARFQNNLGLSHSGMR